VRKLLLLIVLGAIPILMAPVIQVIGTKAPSPGVVKTWGSTPVQSVYSNGLTGATFNITVPATGLGNLLFIQLTDTSGSAAYVSAVSGGGTWVVPTAGSSTCQFVDNSAGSVGCAYVLSSTSGTTTITITPTITTDYYSVEYWEESWTGGGSASLDIAGSVSHNSALTSIPGVTLSLGGNDVCFQDIVLNGGTPVLSISSPYNTNAVYQGFYGYANAANITTSTSPSWTSTSLDTAAVVGAACFE